MSPSDPNAMVFERASVDLAQGVREEWIVDPSFRTIVVLVPGMPPRPLGIGDVLESAVLPGLALALASIFD